MLTISSPAILHVLLPMMSMPRGCHWKQSQLPVTTTQVECQNLVAKLVAPYSTDNRSFNIIFDHVPKSPKQSYMEMKWQSIENTQSSHFSLVLVPFCQKGNQYDFCVSAHDVWLTDIFTCWIHIHLCLLALLATYPHSVTSACNDLHVDASHKIFLIK